MDTYVFKILSTLCEIQDILYAGKIERTVENILRLHDQVFLHASLIKESVGSKAKLLTDRMLSRNTSMQLFVMYHLSSTTSNQHPEHDLLNNVIRMQVRKEMNLSELTKQQHEVRKLCQSLQKCNTIIPFWVIDKYTSEWEKERGARQPGLRRGEKRGQRCGSVLKNMTRKQGRECALKKRKI